MLKYLSGIERRVVDDSAAGFQHTEKRNDVVWCVSPRAARSASLPSSR
jgi:hypothetical protein